MRIKKFHGIIAALWMMVGAAGPGSAKDHAVGTLFTDVIAFDFRSGEFQVPLPPGDWGLVSNVEYSSGGDAFAVTMARLYLVRHDATLLTGGLRISLPKELVDSHWNKSKVCSAKRKSWAWYVDDSSFDRNENCNIVYPLRGFRRNYKPMRQVFEYVEQRKLLTPNAWVFARFYRSRDSDYLAISYALPQEHYGFPRERKYSNTNSPWSINNVHNHPKKEEFKDKAAAWAKSWQKLVDLGFDNKLRRETVQAHPRIDGMAALPTPENRAPRMAAKPTPSPAKRVRTAPERMAKLTPPPKSRIPDGSLKPAQLKNIIVGQTAFGLGSLSDSRVIFGKRGDLDGRLTRGNTDYEDFGRWSVDKSGRLCLDWNNEEFATDACFRTVKRGTKILMQDDGGDTIFVLESAFPKNAKTVPLSEPQLADGTVDPTVLKKLLIGKEASSTLGLDKSIVEFLPHGRMDGRQWVRVTEIHDNGTWKVDSSGRLCLDWDQQEFSPDACYQTIKRGKTILMQDEGGDTIFVVQL